MGAGLPALAVAQSQLEAAQVRLPRRRTEQRIARERDLGHAGATAVQPTAAASAVPGHTI